ncbi:hypothetical protein [Streptomyces scopuliridis]|uniref:Uncharacterized protein n=1 Tax=Streptomyces scopuliridis RB72 TaxID=1440053 RepID=A0A2T7SP18_9ACTN|nr:hypothetical protein [Streptomyces scopuliridis]PVE04648.1 hypothetical protein Y717_10660 [Streptomyces scopuliridis RB72]
MSITTEAPVTRDARDLLTAEELTAVSATVQLNNPGMALSVAESIVLEALKFEAACAAHPTARLKPSRVVDEGWHALILHTRVKAKLAERLGLFVHHVPEAPDTGRHDPDALARTQAAISAAGYTPVPAMWTGPSDTSIPVAASCEHSPPPPEGSCTGDCSNTGPN